MKSEILPHLSLVKHGCVSKSNRADIIPCGLHKPKTACLWQITSAFPWKAVPVAREQRALQPLELVVASLHVFRAFAHLRVSTTHWFCLVFSKKFNIMSAFVVHQSPTLPQKIDSREGLFWCEIGLACACGKMNFYLKRLPFTPVSGQFATKCSAFCR